VPPPEASAPTSCCTTESGIGIVTLGSATSAFFALRLPSAATVPVMWIFWPTTLGSIGIEPVEPRPILAVVTSNVNVPGFHPTAGAAPAVEAPAASAATATSSAIVMRLIGPSTLP